MEKELAKPLVNKDDVNNDYVENKEPTTDD